VSKKHAQQTRSLILFRSHSFCLWRSHGNPCPAQAEDPIFCDKDHDTTEH